MPRAGGDRSSVRFPMQESQNKIINPWPAPKIGQRQNQIGPPHHGEDMDCFVAALLALKI
jgi:hypothetical protein